MTTVCRLHLCGVQRNLFFGSLLIRKYQPSPPATVLEALPARLVVHVGRHWIRDTNHTAADQPFAASKQDSHDAEASLSNSSLTHDHQKRGDDETTFEHVHVPLVKYPSRFLEQMKQQKLREVRIKYDQLQTKTSGANHRSWIFSFSFCCLFPHVFVISLTLETHVLFETRITCEKLPTMTFQQNVFFFAKKQESHAVINNSRPQLFC